jgi:hypothetical protein
MKHAFAEPSRAGLAALPSPELAPDSVPGT